MRHTYVILGDGSLCALFSQPIINALIESFCLHARSLIEFFSGNTTPADNMAAAKHFAKTGYEPCDEESPNKTLKGKLNAQIAHPSYSRTSKDSEKLSAENRATLMTFIETELARFSKEIKETYKPHWPSDMEPRSKNTAQAQVTVSGPVGPSNQIGNIGPTGPTGPVGPTPSSAFVYSTDPAGRRP